MSYTLHLIIISLLTYLCREKLENMISGLIIFPNHFIENNPDPIRINKRKYLKQNSFTEAFRELPSNN